MAAPEITLPEAADLLRLPVESVRALVGAGYLQPTGGAADGPRFSLVDLKAFLARNSGSEGEGAALGEAERLDDLDPQALLDAVDGRSEDMARRALDLLMTVVPDAARWSLGQQARFIDDARARFEAIIAVASLGPDIDEALVEELAAVGGDAAWASTPLHEVLLVLRISRDLVVQTAVEVAEERGRHWGLALSLVLTRVLPALDRLTDAVARGYWGAAMQREHDVRARYENVVEHTADGVYEVRPDGRITYANAAFGLIVGRRPEELAGAPLVDVLRPTEALTLDAPRQEVAIQRADGVIRRVEIRTVARSEDGVLVGYDGLVRDVSAALEAEQLRNDFVALIGHALRQPLATVAGLGATLEEHGPELGPDRVRSVGERIRTQAEGMRRLADDLFAFSRLELGTLVLSPRDVRLADVVEHAVAVVAADEGVDLPEGAVVVDVPEELEVIADPGRLEQVIVNLFDNALRYGAPPVVIAAEHVVDEVEVVVRDHGDGVPPELVPRLFSELRPLTGRPRRQPAHAGLGLALVRGLVEAMGGRVRYETADTAGAVFVISLPSR